MEEENVFNPKGRRLCPDGSCVGILDAAGRCGECGRSFVAETSGNAEAGDGGAPQPVGLNTERKSSGPVPAGDGDTGFNPNRRLCDDGTCVGIVQSDGTCNTCGRVARS